MSRVNPIDASDARANHQTIRTFAGIVMVLAVRLAYIAPARA